MNIVVYCQSAAKGRGGMERTAANVANEMFSRGHNVCFVYEIDPICTFTAYPLSAGIKILPWHQDICEEAFANIMINFSADVALILYCNEREIELPFRLLANCCLPIVLHEGTNPERIKHAWNRKNEDGVNLHQRSVYHSAASAVRVTLPSYLDSIDFLDDERKISFPNAFVRNSNAGQAVKRKQIIHVNGFKQNKNLLPVLQAMSTLRTRFGEWQLLLVGRAVRINKHHESIYQFIETHQLEDIIKFSGVVENIDDVFASSDIHVISSHSEGLPNVVIEAMCNGIPSIGYAFCPGTNELIVHNQNGLLVEEQEGEVKGLTEAMAQLMADSNLRRRLGCQAYQDSQMFEPKLIFDQWERMLTNAAKDKINSFCLSQPFSDILPEECRLHKLRQLRKLGINPCSSGLTIERRTSCVNKTHTLLFVLTNAPLGSLGTIGTSEVIRRLAKTYKVIVISEQRNPAVVFDDSGFTVTYVDSFNSKETLSLVQQILVEESVDLVHIYRGQGEFKLLNEIYRISHQKQLGVKIIYDIKSPILAEEPKRTELAFNIQKSAPLIDHIISLSDFTFKHNIKLPLSPHSIIPLGINIPKQPRLPQATLQIKKLVYIGSLTKKRGVLKLIKWFSSYSRISDNDLYLDIYGHGNQSHEIETYIKKHKLMNSVVLKGFIPQEQLFAKLSDYDAGIAYVPDNETFSGSPSLKLIEFAAFGLPILATATAAHRDYVQKYQLEATLFEDDETDFHKAVKDLCSVGVSIDSLNHNIDQASKFEFDNLIIEHIEPIYQNLLVSKQTSEAAVKEKA
ncbi:MAG: glycosyltransferase [Xanthomonadales bacterium]|nr:glycosyltransferase [Xanthomonadales bacterium]